MQLSRHLVAALLLLSSGFMPLPSHATDMPSTHSFTFRPVASGIVPDENGSTASAHVVSNRGDAWIESEIGAAVELGEVNERIELATEVFPGNKGAIRITFRPTLQNGETQHLFRVYGRGDGLVLFIQDGQLSFRYYNRETRQRVSGTLPAQATPMGEWSSVIFSWDLEDELKLQIASGKFRRAAKVPSEWPVHFQPDSRVLLGNEHAGGAPFHGAIQSIQFFSTPIWSDEDAQAEADLPRSPVPIPAVERKRLTPYTFFFSRTQPKYDLFSNTLLRRWIDRPLFFDRRTASGETANSIVTSASFLKTQETLFRYELDGFSVLMAAPQQGQAFLEMVDYLDQAEDVQAVPLVMEVSGSSYSDERREEAVKGFIERAQRALDSKNIFRVNEKILVLSYAMDLASPSEFKAFRTAVEAKLGDQFLFIADTTVNRPPLLREFNDIGGLTEPTQEAFREHLRSWLEVCDGLMWAGGVHTNHPNGTFHRTFYREALIPMMKQVLAEPKYAGKLFGLDAEVGYVNVMTSRRIGKEEHTQRLRDNLQIALETQPDFIAMPEWDELNENTSIGPTLTNSLTTQRILRAYMEQFPGRPPLREPSEDRSIPNVIISSYPEIRLGDWIEIELVSLPEHGATGSLTAALELKNLSGKVVHTFPSVTLDQTKISDHLFRLPSEELANESVLLPSLKITDSKGRQTEWEEGLEAIRVSATWGLNVKSTKIHLRDLLQPTLAKFEVLPSDAGFKVNAVVKAEEPIASVEVLQGSRELVAYDPTGELAVEQGEALIHLQWQAMRNPTGMKGVIRVENGALKKFVDWTRPEYKRASYRLTPQLTKAGHWEVPFETDEGVNSTNARGGFLTITDPETAQIVMETDRFIAKFPVKELLAGGRMARVFNHGVTVEAAPLKMLGQVPHPILEKEVAFSTEVEPWRKEYPLQLRVVTMSGKIYRSRPVDIHSQTSPEVPLNVWSKSQQQAISLKVARHRIPEIEAVFAPERGDLLPSREGDYFHGLIGGVPFDMAAFAKRHLSGSYPAAQAQTTPKWVSNDGERLLSFNGKGNFLYFPEETIPRGSFHVEFEIKPTASHSYTLCSQRGYRSGGLTVNVMAGELVAIYLGGDGKMNTFKSGLKIPTGEWSKVSIAYDLKEISLQVNDEKASIACEGGPNRIINPFVFGGYGNGRSIGYFEGLLKAIRISHTSAPLPPPLSTALRLRSVVPDSDYTSQFSLEEKAL